MNDIVLGFPVLSSGVNSAGQQRGPTGTITLPDEPFLGGRQPSASSLQPQQTTSSPVNASAVVPFPNENGGGGGAGGGGGSEIEDCNSSVSGTNNNPAQASIGGSAFGGVFAGGSPRGEDGVPSVERPHRLREGKRRIFVPNISPFLHGLESIGNAASVAATRRRQWSELFNNVTSGGGIVARSGNAMNGYGGAGVNCHVVNETWVVSSSGGGGGGLLSGVSLDDQEQLMSAFDSITDCIAPATPLLLTGIPEVESLRPLLLPVDRRPVLYKTLGKNRSAGGRGGAGSSPGPASTSPPSAFFYDPFAADRERRKVRRRVAVWAAGETCQVLLTLSNPLGVPVRLIRVQVVVDVAVRCLCSPVTLVLPPLCSSQEVVLEVMPLTLGQLRILGLRYFTNKAMHTVWVDDEGAPLTLPCEVNRPWEYPRRLVSGKTVNAVDGDAASSGTNNVKPMDDESGSVRNSSVLVAPRGCWPRITSSWTSRDPSEQLHIYLGETLTEYIHIETLPGDALLRDLRVSSQFGVRVAGDTEGAHVLGGSVRGLVSEGKGPETLLPFRIDSDGVAKGGGVRGRWVRLTIDEDRVLEVWPSEKGHPLSPLKIPLCVESLWSGEGQGRWQALLEDAGPQDDHATAALFSDTTFASTVQVDVITDTDTGDPLPFQIFKSVHENSNQSMDAVTAGGSEVHYRRTTISLVPRLSPAVSIVDVQYLHECEAHDEGQSLSFLESYLNKYLAKSTEPYGADFHSLRIIPTKAIMVCEMCNHTDGVVVITNVVEILNQFVNNGSVCGVAAGKFHVLGLLLDEKQGVLSYPDRTQVTIAIAPRSTRLLMVQITRQLLRRIRRARSRVTAPSNAAESSAPTGPGSIDGTTRAPTSCGDFNFSEADVKVLSCVDSLRWLLVDSKGLARWGSIPVPALLSGGAVVGNNADSQSPVGVPGFTVSTSLVPSGLRTSCGKTSGCLFAVEPFRFHRVHIEISGYVDDVDKEDEREAGGGMWFEVYCLVLGEDTTSVVDNKIGGDTQVVFRGYSRRVVGGNLCNSGIQEQNLGEELLAVHECEVMFLSPNEVYSVHTFVRRVRESDLRGNTESRVDQGRLRECGGVAASPVASETSTFQIEAQKLWWTNDTPLVLVTTSDGGYV